MIRYDAVLLDFEGTLAFMDPPHAQIYVDACAAHGHAITAAGLRKTLDEGWREFETPYGVVHQQYSTTQARSRELRRMVHAARLHALGIPEEDVAAIAAAVAEEEVALRYYHWFPDAVPSLRALADLGCRLCVVSNHMWELPDIVDGLGHEGFELPVITSARAGCRKPFPDIYHRALDLVDTEPRRTLFVGDHVVNDVEAPARLDMAGMLIDRKGRRPYAGPTIHSLAELPGVVEAGVERVS